MAAQRKERRIVRILKRTFRSVADEPETVLPRQELVPDTAPPKKGVEWRQRPKEPDEYGLWIDGFYAARVWRLGYVWYARAFGPERKQIDLGTAFTLQQAQDKAEKIFGY